MRTKQLASSGPSRMSPREQQVFELMLTGAPCKVMAQDLGLSHRTVEVHRAHILRIMGATTTNEVIRMWYEAQLAARDEQIAALTARLAGPRTLSVRDMFNEEETRLAKPQASRRDRDIVVSRILPLLIKFLVATSLVRWC